MVDRLERNDMGLISKAQFWFDWLMGDRFNNLKNELLKTSQNDLEKF